jgi:predicted  nucleic acid-binding Zn-ribbon protein
MQLEEALETQRNQNKETSSKFMDLKRKFKTLDEMHTKMKNSVIPKVNSTKEYQKELKEQIGKIREDSAMLPDMFRQLVQDS